MVKSLVKVFVRTRPTSSSYDGVKVLPDGSSITVTVPKHEDAGLINNQQESYSFKYDTILDNASQDNVYTSAAHEVVESVLAGYNGTVFCYGQTGSGKTFTMSGDPRQYQHRGIIPRALHHIFREVDMRADKMYKIQVSYLEIYNDQMYDLLSSNPGTSDLSILDDSNGNTYVRGLTQVSVGSEEEALGVFFSGEAGRSVASHVLNSSSSRSHAVFSISVEMRTSEAASERAVLSKLHLVDLAGSERTKKTHVTGQALKEAQFINKSLSFLEQTVNALSRRDAYIPFRQSKLTALLRDALGGNCKTIMIANVWGESTHVEETISTLRFAARVKTLVTDISHNESTDPALLIKKYQRQVAELKQELAMRDTLSGRGRVLYEDMAEDAVRELHALVKRFFAGEVDLDELPADSLKRIRETYKATRNVFQGMQAELQAQVQSGGSRTAEAGSVQGGVNWAIDPSAVGDEDRAAGKGFTVGTAPADARPTSRYHDAAGAASPSSASLNSPRTAGSGRDAAAFASPSSPHSNGGIAGDPNQAFRSFKAEHGEGRALAASLKDKQEAVATLKQRIKDLGASVNSSKSAIDDLNHRLATKVPLSESEVLDSEAYECKQQLRDVKARYRAEFDELKECRGELDLQLTAAAEARRALVEAFNAWSGQDADVEPGDVADEREAFETMRLNKITTTDPESSAFYAARRAAASGLRASGQFTGMKTTVTRTPGLVR